MAFAKDSGTAATLALLFDKLEYFMVTTLGWTSKKNGTSTDDLAREYTIFHSTGESTQEDIYWGLSSFHYSDERCGLHFNGYTGFNCDKEFTDQPGAAIFCPSLQYCAYTQMPYMPLHNHNMSYRFWGDKDMVTGIIGATGGLYQAFYVGLCRRYALRCQDPYPMVVDGSGVKIDAGMQCVNCCTANIGRCSGCCHSPGRHNLMYAYDQWINYRYQANTTLHTHKLVWPCHMLKAAAMASNRYVLFPILLSNLGGDRGEFKWVYKVAGEGLQVLDVIQVGGNDYVVFPDPGEPTNTQWWLAFRDYV